MLISLLSLKARKPLKKSFVFLVRNRYKITKQLFVIIPALQLLTTGREGTIFIV